MRERQEIKVGYVVSRFPHVSETFILRELDAVDEQPGIEISLLSLFAPVAPVVHPAAVPWLARLSRPRVLESLSGLFFWLRRNPKGLLSCLVGIVRGNARRPSVLGRALVTLPLAASHARSVLRLGVVHVHAHYATYPTLTAWICKRLAGVPYSFTAHAHDLFIQQCHLREKVRDASFVVAVSEFNRDFLTDYGGEFETPVHVVHCGIDPAGYRYRPRACGDEGPVLALCVGSLQEYKGHRILFEALTMSSPAIDRVSLDLVGDGELRQDLEREVARLGLTERVRFHGSLPEHEVSALLDRADLFVLASTVARTGQMDGIPVALMEALACGAPVVASNLSGIPELVRHGETGLLADPGDPASLKRALEQLINHDAATLRRAEAGRRLVESEFDNRTSARRLATLFAATRAKPRIA